MTQAAFRIMILLGSALMVYNISRWFGFAKKMRWIDRSTRVHRALYLPAVLLISFLLGYLGVAIFGRPELLVALILFGGSIFVFIILRVLYFIVDKVMTSQEALLEEKQASAAKTQFFSNISHDLRTPLNAIIGYTQLGLREGTQQEEMHSYLDKINASGRHLLSLIDDVLEMSRIENGKMELRPEKTDLCKLLCDARDLFDVQMRSKGIAFTVDGSGLKDRGAVCDGSLLSRALLNLLSNAYKFTPEGGSIGVVLQQTGRHEELADYELRVKDSGIGMSKEFSEKLFEPFERERTSTVSGIQGTGLGMTITKAIVDSMGGSIEVESEQGKGTEFIIRLSLPVAEGGESGCSCADAKSKQYDFSGKKLLLAEDNEINREIAVALLTDAGFAVDTAENGQVALGMLTAAPAGAYDAVLMDIQMPVMDGVTASKAIRALADPALSSIPIVAMTANVFGEDLEREREAGMTAHISKPLHVEQMLGTLAEALG